MYASTKRESEEQTGQDARCQSLILLINMLYADVKRGLESYNQIFSRILGINYFSIAYLQFAEKVWWRGRCGSRLLVVACQMFSSGP